MRSRRLPIDLKAALAILAVTLFVTSAWAPPREKVLHNFSQYSTDGYYPAASLIFDAHGILYGTTSGGGAHNAGMVFKLTPKAGGGWIEEILHNFNDNGRDGAHPSASLIFDADGNLYGTTYYGGSLDQCGGYGCGTVFELTPKAGGGWTEKVLHNFSGKDGSSPNARLVVDADGSLYSTTTGGGVGGGGTVFELTPHGGGWTEKTLHNFSGRDGFYPVAGVVMDDVGNLYGTTTFGGSIPCNFGNEVGCGTVFELTPKGGGNWTEKVLHNFNYNGKDGVSPQGDLTTDAAGNLYGTTYYGGPFNDQCDSSSFGCGTVFELTSKVGRGWTEKVLHSFNENGSDGTFPQAGLIFDAHGNLYGTTSGGGLTQCTGSFGCGTVFELRPKSDGGWTERILHNFNGRNGAYSTAGLIFDAHGNLFGTTFEGGPTPCNGGAGCGTAFEITP
jgi:uncharacterized repeat protein (TIGR03803 family)